MGPWLIACLLLSSACQSPPPESTPSPSTRPSPQESPAGFGNPVYDGNFPDPMVIAGADGGFVAVATNGNGSNVQTLTSTDLIDWEQGPDALPQLPSWSRPGKVWAPEIATGQDGRFLLYYTTRSPDPEVQCISVAVGSKAIGPFVDRSSKPLVCEKAQGGSIDASPFTTADGRRYLYWKNDGNAVGVDTYISGQRLDRTGTKLIGRPQRLFKQNLPWEGHLVEAPFSWEHDGKIHLFYSANAYDSNAYAVGHAIAGSPLGTFTKDEEPVLVSNEVAAGPGHCALIEKGGTEMGDTEKGDTVWMVFHAWMPDAIGGDVPGRTMWLTEVTFGSDATVEIQPPTLTYPDRP